MARPDAIKPLLEIKNGELNVPEWGVEFDKPWLVDREHELGSKSVHAALEGPGLAGPGRHREGAARARDLAARNDRRQEPVHGRRRRPQLRGQRPDRARGRLRQHLDPAGSGRRRHRDRLRVLRPSGDPEKAALLRDEPAYSRHGLQRRRCRGPPCDRRPGSPPDNEHAQRRHLRATRRSCWPKATCSAGFRAAPNSGRARSATAASWPTRARPR